MCSLRVSTTIVAVALTLCAIGAAVETQQQRVAVVTNNPMAKPKGPGMIGKGPSRVASSTWQQHLAFSTTPTGELVLSTSANGVDWSNWFVIDQTKDITSNPVAIVSNITVGNAKERATATPLVQVFAQTKDGQAICFTQTGPTSFKRQVISTAIPSSLPPTQFSPDAVQVTSLNNLTSVFVRSQTNSSGVYWAHQLTDATWSGWVAIGDASNFLLSDPFVVVNTFVNRMEVYGLFTDRHIHHTWQTGSTSFSDKWHKLGSALSKTEFSSSPVVHPMAPNFFNGNLEVFARGTDGVLRHIWQTTCDKVKNPWGPCTWDLSFHSIGGQVPADKSDLSVLSVNRNIHLGQEVFVIGADDKHLYHMWQSERDASWSDWEDIGGLTASSAFFSQPSILLDEYGWWQAYAMNTSSLVSRYTQRPLSFSLSKSSLAFGDNVTASWSIPKDEATHMDWIGVYASGAVNHDYVDFRYVGGGQNPVKGAIPSGNLTFQTFLPNGEYDFRYLVNKQFDAVLQGSLSILNGTQDPEWVQLYRGFARGMGGLGVNITKCVQDGETTVDTFRDAFKAFENREIFKGLHLIAQGLGDFRDALVQCNETIIVKDLEKFIEDLIACTEDSCDKLIIDIGVEIIILYERIYEIYGDILSARNSFGIDAYEQGGICIGRVTYACLSLPSI